MKISISIPAYKAHFLQECIESILNQTYKDFEVVIVNDNSPEDLDSIIYRFNDERIKYYKNEKNCGALNVVDNWNICLHYATGDYIICMGDDDKLLPNCLEEYIKLIKLYPNLGIYHAWTQIIDENSNIIRIQEPRPLYEKVFSMMWNRWNGRIQYIGDFLFNIKLLKENGGFYKLPLAWASDDISTYIAAQDTGIANMQVPGFQYRINSQTISRTGNSLIKLKAIIQEEIWYKNFLSTEINKNDIVEYTYLLMLKKRLLSYISKKKIQTISSDLNDNGIIHLFKYWRHRKELELNYKILGYAVIELFKNKYKNSH